MIVIGNRDGGPLQRTPLSLNALYMSGGGAFVRVRLYLVEKTLC
jgi:hypothetical protein